MRRQHEASPLAPGHGRRGRARGARVAIVGAGIGGLCAAHAVARGGHDPIVLERAASDSAIGAGLVLWPNAVAALDRLGLGNRVRADAAVAERTVVRSIDGTQLAAIDVNALSRRAGAPMLLIERAKLHAILGAGLAVRHGAEVSTIAAGSVILVTGEEIAAEAVVAADGINSTVRASVAPGCVARDTGYAAIRGIASHDLGAGSAFEIWGSGALAGGAALPGQRTYWFYEARSDTIDAASPLDALRTDHWPDPVPALIARTHQADLLVNRIRTLPRLPTWVNGTTALLGDAAHAMAPNLGQGAAQAIEDAAALFTALRAGADLPDALALYAASRQTRARRIQRESDRMAKLALSRHPAPRNLLMRAIPDSLRTWAIERTLGSQAIPQ